MTIGGDWKSTRMLVRLDCVCCSFSRSFDSWNVLRPCELWRTNKHSEQYSWVTPDDSSNAPSRRTSIDCRGIYSSIGSQDLQTWCGGASSRWPFVWCWHSDAHLLNIHWVACQNTWVVNRILHGIESDTVANNRDHLIEDCPPTQRACRPPSMPPALVFSSHLLARASKTAFDVSPFWRNASRMSCEQGSKGGWSAQSSGSTHTKGRDKMLRAINKPGKQSYNTCSLPYAWVRTMWDPQTFFCSPLSTVLLMLSLDHPGLCALPWRQSAEPIALVSAYPAPSLAAMNILSIPFKKSE